MVMLPACLLAVGPLALSLFSLAVAVVFGAAVVDMVLTHLPFVSTTDILICCLFDSNPLLVSMAVMVMGVVRHSRRGSLPWKVGFVMMVLVTTQQRPIVGLNTQWPVMVGLRVGPHVERRRKTETLLRIQFTVQSLTTCSVLPP